MIQTDDYLLEFLEKGLPEAGTVGRIPYPKLQENYEQIKRG